jgi:hypothetical protein
MLAAMTATQGSRTFERYIAIDGVCAWPNLTRLADGTIIATIFNQPCHGRWEGDVECWASVDGRFWQKRGTPAPHEPGTVRMNVAAGLAGDGALVVLASGWTHRPPAPRPLPIAPHDPMPPSDLDPETPQVLTPWVCRSGDGGRTWTRSGSVECPPRMTCLIPFGDILADDEGNLGASFYGWDKMSTRRTGQRLSWFFRSGDGGRSWRPVSLIGEVNSNETALLHLGGGVSLAAARTASEQMLELFRSSDNGESWQLCGAVSMPGQIPGHLLRLADGRILLHYGIRNPGTHGVGIRYSSDEGQTWGPPRILLTYESRADGGYPSCVQLDDGTLVTAYYASSAADHQRYHMGVLRWRADE